MKKIILFSSLVLVQHLGAAEVPLARKGTISFINTTGSDIKIAAYDLAGKKIELGTIKEDQNSVDKALALKDQDLAKLKQYVVYYSKYPSAGTNSINIPALSKDIDQQGGLPAVIELKIGGTFGWGISYRILGKQETQRERPGQQVSESQQKEIIKQILGLDLDKIKTAGDLFKVGAAPVVNQAKSWNSQSAEVRNYFGYDLPNGFQRLWKNYLLHETDLRKRGVSVTNLAKTITGNYDKIIERSGISKLEGTPESIIQLRMPAQ